MIAQYLPDFNLYHLLIVCVALALGGFVKGISAFGLPTIAVPIIVFFMSLPAAVAIMVFPMIITNFVQMMISGQVKMVLSRHWRLFLGLALGLPVGVYLLSAVDTRYLLIVVGSVLILIATLEMSGISFAFLGRREKLFGPIIGVIAGVIGGITTLYGTLPIFFFVALDLKKEVFIATVSAFLFFGSIFLMLSLQTMNFLRVTEAVYSVIGLVPLFAGMWAGTHVRHRIDQRNFKKIVLLLVGLIGAIMIYRAFS
ncbi:sulfite exporter TauE/SafE family protein [Sneathiella sp.]|uniref:sulfite exporter TauE/SafE family protein n=1 Tax=Sneathiella sp. TaxID=1964365 RepID=UPI003569D3A3